MVSETGWKRLWEALTLVCGDGGAVAESGGSDDSEEYETDSGAEYETDSDEDEDEEEEEVEEVKSKKKKGKKKSRTKSRRVNSSRSVESSGSTVAVRKQYKGYCCYYCSLDRTFLD